MMIILVIFSIDLDLGTHARQMFFQRYSSFFFLLHGLQHLSESKINENEFLLNFETMLLYIFLK